MWYSINVALESSLGTKGVELGCLQTNSRALNHFGDTGALFSITSETFRVRKANLKKKNESEIPNIA